MTAYGQAQARPMAGGHRRRLAVPSRAGRRAHPAGALLAGVLLTFMVGLIYLGLMVHLAATHYQVEQLTRERDDLARQVQTQETTMLRWGAEPMVLERGQSAGLNQLGTRLRLPATVP